MMFVAASTAATGQQARNPGYERFKSFFSPLVGVWPVQIVDRDEYGKIEFQTVQLRDFNFVAGGRFVRETALMRDSSARQAEVGIHLFGYDGRQDRVLIHGFWGNSADRFVFVPARFEGQDLTTALVGMMVVTHGDGRRVETQSRMQWESPTRFSWRTTGKRKDGSTFPDEELIYTIVPIGMESRP